MNVEIGPREQPAGDDNTVYVDCVKRPGVSHATVWGSDRLPFDDCSVDSVYASHVIEHVPWFQTDYALAEVFRVLRRGGRVELWCPDFAALVTAYLAGAIPRTEKWRRFNPTGDLMKWVNGRLFAYFNDTEGPENLHKSAHDFSSLSAQLNSAGFVNIERAKRNQGHNPHGPCEFGVIAYKA